MITNKEKNFVSIVLYIHNDAEKLEITLKTIDKKIRKRFEKYEIICVNDASIDNSEDRIKEFGSNNKDTIISIINMSYYQGREFAMNAGRDLAIGDFVFEFDSSIIDYDAELIDEIYFKSLEGYDIVSAVPLQNSYLSSKLFYCLFNKFSNSNYKLQTERFRILSRRAINRIQSMSITIPYRKAIYANCGLAMSTISYEPQNNNRYSIDEESSFRKKNATDSLILFTEVAYKITFFLAAIMMIFTISVAIYTVYTYSVNQFVAAGWTTTMLFLALAFFVTFVILAIIIKYLSVLIGLVFNNQKYLIKSIDKITDQ